MATIIEPTHNKSVWLADAELNPPVRRPLGKDLDVDVTIIGAGYTGLWTAFYLKSLAPELSVVVLESQTCGFGASGRNGGWLKGGIAGEHTYLAPLPEHQRQTARKILSDTVEQVKDVLVKEDIDCDFAHGGVLYAAARYPEQLTKQLKYLEQLRTLGYTEDDYRWLDAAQLEERVRMRKPYGAIYSPHCAVIAPLKLAQGLALNIESKGVSIYEHTKVNQIDWSERRVICSGGSVRSRIIVPALEAYAGSIPGGRRHILPVQSLIVATEPLPESTWQEIGLHDRTAFADGSSTVTYGQRSGDDRLIFGARGGYQFGGKTRDAFNLENPEFEIRTELMRDLFPALADVKISHGWGGTLGMSRRFAPHAIYDAQSGIALAGGYGGTGVGAANLFARTLVDLMLERETELTQMPWAFSDAAPDQLLRRWEPEPFRWLTYKAIVSIYEWEETLYRNDSGDAWQKALASVLSRALTRLIT